MQIDGGIGQFNGWNSPWANFVVPEYDLVIIHNLSFSSESASGPGTVGADIGVDAGRAGSILSNSRFVPSLRRR